MITLKNIPRKYANRRFSSNKKVTRSYNYHFTNCCKLGVKQLKTTVLAGP